MTAQSLPPRPHLDQLKRQAKELLRRDPSVGRLRDAQRAIAHEYGFPSWDALRTHVDSAAGSAAGRAAPRPHRGLTYEDELPGTTAITQDLTPASARRFAEQGVTAVKIEPAVSAATLAHLAECPEIRGIDLSGRRDLIDRDLAFLERMPWLTAISLGRCESIGDAGVGYLHRHQQLEEITLQGTNTGDGAVGHLAGKLALQRVALGAQLTDRGVALLRELSALRAPGADDSFLAISSAPALTDTALEALGDLAGVIALDISYSHYGSRHYTTAGVAHLSRMVSLAELNFRGDLATDAVLGEIARIPRLRRLICQDMVAGDEGFMAWRDARRCNRSGDGIAIASAIAASRRWANCRVFATSLSVDAG